MRAARWDGTPRRARAREAEAGRRPSEEKTKVDGEEDEDTHRLPGPSPRSCTPPPTLLTLLGVPGLPPRVQSAPAAEGVAPEPFTDWELDALLRRRAIENVRGSTETLEGIVRLVDQIEGMPVGPDVKGDVQDALAALDDVRALAMMS